MENERILPIYIIAGTTFIIDVDKDELRQLNNPANTISFSEMNYQKFYYDFHYDMKSKNIGEGLTDSSVFIQAPNLTVLDPLGMAQKYGMAESEITGKTDIEVMIDQGQLALREGGQLPVIEIAGHPFYVDIRMDALRPKDDFTTMGIRFNDIADYFLEDRNCYVIPYDPNTHAVKELDMDQIRAIPKGIIAIEIPPEEKLDPIAFARQYGFNKEHILRNNPLQMQMKAKEVSWKGTVIKKMIAQNIKQDLEKKETNKTNKPKRKKGRGI